MTQSSSSARALITVAVMAATVMQVLDTTIVNVALPHMAGQLNATPDQISWVLTSYLVASGIFMPLTGFFTARLGQKKYLLLSILGFSVTSALCGLSANLSEIVLFRLLQGIFGAALVPLSQSIMLGAYPPQERGKAMAIWGIGVMVGPILGPTLGGYLTEVLNWRWTFFINVPVGLFSLLVAMRVVPETERRKRDMDWIGLILVFLAIGGLQFMLDRGNDDDWFDARSIQVAAALSIAGVTGFLIHGWTHRGETLFDPRIFRDRNFATSSLLIGAFGLGLFGMMVLQPMMIESLLGFPTFTTGLLMAPRAFASMFSMFMVGRLVNRVDPRILITIGIMLSTAGTYVATHYYLGVDSWWLVWPVMIQGFGLGMVFVPLSTIAYSTLDPKHAAEAAGLFSLLRTIGSSIGISIATTILTRHTQIAWNQIGANIQPFNPALSAYLDRLHLDITDPQAGLILGQELSRQASMVGFVDAFTFIMWSFLAMLPMVLIMAKAKPKPAAAPTVPVAAD